MELSDRLDVRAVVKHNSTYPLRAAAIFLVGVPLAAVTVGWLYSLWSHKGIDMMAWVVSVLSVMLGAAFLAWGANDWFNPLGKKELKWREFGSPREIIALIESDWNDSPPTAKERVGRYRGKTGIWVVMPHWLLRLDSGVFFAYPLRYVAWGFWEYKSFRGGSSYEVTIYRTDKPGQRWAFDTSGEEEATKFLLAVQKRAPWGRYGYSREKREQWRTDKKAFARAIEARYEDVVAGKSVPQDGAATVALSPDDAA